MRPRVSWLAVLALALPPIVPAASAQDAASAPPANLKIIEAVVDVIERFKGDTCFSERVKLGTPDVFRKELLPLTITISPGEPPRHVEYKEGGLGGILETPPNELRVPFDPLKSSLADTQRRALYHEAIHQIESLRGVKRDNKIPGAERNTDYTSDVIGALDTWAVIERQVRTGQKPGPDDMTAVERYAELADAMRAAETKWGPDRELAVWAGFRARFSDIHTLYLTDACGPALKAMAEEYAGFKGLVEREFWDDEKTVIKREFEYVVTGGRKMRHGKERVYYQSGKLAYEAVRKDNALHGPLTRYWENGQVFDAATYQEGSREGPYAAYYSGGKPRAQGQFIGGRKVGPWVTYYEGGKFESSGSYPKEFRSVQRLPMELMNKPEEDKGFYHAWGTKTGPWTYYYHSGRKESEVVYDDEGNTRKKDDSLVGPFRSYYDNAANSLETEIVASGSTKYYENGGLKEKCPAIGACRYWNPDGTEVKR